MARKINRYVALAERICALLRLPEGDGPGELPPDVRIGLASVLADCYHSCSPATVESLDLAVERMAANILPPA